jgi:hypothetical protein
VSEEFSLGLEKPARELARGALRGALESVRDFIFRPRETASGSRQRRILIIGPGGTGKTTLARFLSGDVDWFEESPGQYLESIDLELFALNDDPDVELVVAPGQEYRRASTWPELLRQVAEGAFRGIVLMNSFGYHTFSTPSYRNHRLYAGNKSSFFQAFLADRLEDELRILREIVPHLLVCNEKVWVLTIISKQDLWWNKQKEAEQHYLQGEYKTLLRSVAQKVGDWRFRDELVMMSLIIRNLKTIAGERLQANVSGYDMQTMMHSIRQLLRVLNGLQSWEESE